MGQRKLVGEMNVIVTLSCDLSLADYILVPYCTINL